VLYRRPNAPVRQRGETVPPRHEPYARRVGRQCVIVAIFLAFTGATLAQAFDHSHAAYSTILARHVVDARVDYRSLKAAPRALDDYLDGLANVSRAEFDQWTVPRQLAFLFNLYNAATLRLVVTHYPVKSIKDIGNWIKGPWDQDVVRLFGNRVSLNDLEHDILRKQYNEPRLHLALVCAAKGCPPLRNEAYIAPELDRQLTDQARLFLGSQAGLRIDRPSRTVWLSAIFKWYGQDFVRNHTPAKGFADLSKAERAVLSFCGRHVPVSKKRFLQAGIYSVRYLTYDWSLNDRQR